MLGSYGGCFSVRLIHELDVFSIFEPFLWGESYTQVRLLCTILWYIRIHYFNNCLSYLIPWSMLQVKKATCLTNHYSICNKTLFGHLQLRMTRIQLFGYIFLHAHTLFYTIDDTIDWKDDVIWFVSVVRKGLLK